MFLPDGSIIGGRRGEITYELGGSELSNLITTDHWQCRDFSCLIRKEAKSLLEWAAAKRGLLIYETCTRSELRRFCCQRLIALPREAAINTDKTLIAALRVADDQATFPNFTDLPTELRLHIYAIDFASLPPLEAPAQPPLTQTCRLLRKEALPVFYELSIFVITIISTQECLSRNLEHSRLFKKQRIEDRRVNSSFPYVKQSGRRVPAYNINFPSARTGKTGDATYETTVQHSCFTIHTAATCRVPAKISKRPEGMGLRVRDIWELLRKIDGVRCTLSWSDRSEEDVGEDGEGGVDGQGGKLISDVSEEDVGDDKGDGANTGDGH
ncbi:hypothetical protein LTR62_005639 [Meristemomyces frigidus]|uniref:Uncharacterized protein n=1 Tax=Meristemomyces frigidus TaxID=1508187 RepID=A0AAN7TF82_9PEZI|nr:hypothetical protein LTR62_005639 [Meristemomyces frigidus]